MVKAILWFLMLFSLTTAAAQQDRGRKIYVPKGADNGCMIMPGKIDYNPGDTLVIRGALNPWTYIYLGGINGTRERPVVVINEGKVELSAGIDLANCQYVKVTGSGSRDRYGFHIRQASGTALTIHEKSAHVEAERFYVEDAAFGCWIKNEAHCDTSINNWVLNDISVHDFQMHRIRIEGFYMGSTDANNEGRPIMCNGVQQFYKPSRLGNIKVYNGIIDGTGRPAIMLSGAQVGMSEIYNNTISNVGREYNDQQGTGISLGLYTRAYVHDNKIKNTYTWGIASLGGSGLVRIERNQIDSSGYLDGRTLPWPQNILIDTRRTVPVDSTRFIIANNILRNPGKEADHILVARKFASYAAGNLICNNGKTARVHVEPGIAWKSCGTVNAAAGKSNSRMYVLGLIGLSGLGLVALLYFISRGKTGFLAFRPFRHFKRPMGLPGRPSDPHPHELS